MLGATFARPDLTTFCRLNDLGLEVVGQHLQPDRAGAGVSGNRARQVVPAVRGRARPGRQRHPSPGARAVRLAPNDAAGHDLPLAVHRMRARLASRQQPGGRAAGQAHRDGLRWALVGMVCAHLTVAGVAEALVVAWNTADAPSSPRAGEC